MSIGKRIREARMRAGLSQRELAEKTGIKPQLLCKYEKDIIDNIPLPNIEKIADACEVGGWDIYGWIPELKNGLQEKFEQLDGDDKLEVLNYINYLLSKDKYKKDFNQGIEVS